MSNDSNESERTYCSRAPCLIATVIVLELKTCSIVPLLKMSCNKCRKSMRNDAKIKCGICGDEFHALCVNLKAEELKFFQDNPDAKWNCEVCTRDRRRSMILESAASEGELSVTDIVKTLSKIEENQRRMEADLGKSIVFVHEDIDKILKRMEAQDKRLDLYLQKIESQEMEISSLRKENKELNRRVTEIETYTRINCLEIHNIPMKRSEDVKNIVKAVGKSLNCTIEDIHIDNCHRLPAREGGDSPPIIVKFTRRYEKEALLQKRREKKSLSTLDLDLPTDEGDPSTARPNHTIYINECLCTERRRILAMAKKIKEEKGYKYLWVRGGKIKIRKTEGVQPIVLDTIDDLKKIA